MALILAFVASCNEAAKTPVKGVFFKNIKDGDVITGPVKVEMGINGMTVQPAGEIKEGTGHHHIVVDGAFLEDGKPVPADKKHLHYGKGQTETTLELAPGKHTLTLQFANGAHLSYGKDMSATVNITVK
ncbi:MAG: DUF4399 domain-containing protein [Lentisphaeraceae bacterium]|nr:DUF4399 domain-containing protein [Lentisphaeraceae bacterium]